MIIAILWAMTQSGCSVSAASASTILSISQRAAYINDLPPNLVVPPDLPTGIQDAWLVEGWITLYDQVDPVQLWDGGTLTGRSLAQFILDRSIPVVWDTENKCDGESCSLHYCYEKFCTFEDRKGSVAPIYISLRICNDLQSLVRTLAHEIYHRTEPFGSVPDTLFEEFNAYLVGARISGSDWPKFEGVDPLAPAKMDQWFKDNQFTAYPGLQHYPARTAQYEKSSEKAYGLPSLFHSQVTNPDGQSPK